MANFTYKEIKNIIECTPAEWASKTPGEISQAKTGAIFVGYYKKPSANWSYHVDAVYDGESVRLVVSTFGHILAK